MTVIAVRAEVPGPPRGWASYGNRPVRRAI